MNLPLPHEFRRPTPIASFDPREEPRDPFTSNANLSISATHLARSQRAAALPAKVLEARGMIHAGADPAARAQADAFREIRTRLLAMGGNRNFITLIVPIGNGDGASFVARNLAAAFALDPTKTALLIDCNLRAACQHRVLEVEAKAGGLIDYLEHPARDPNTMIYPTGVANLDLLPVGRAREIDCEYFSLPQMHALLESLRMHDQNRYLFLDGPAVNGSPDARILAELADFVILVCGYARATAKTINQAAAVFNPATFAGVVFNEGR